MWWAGFGGGGKGVWYVFFFVAVAFRMQKVVEYMFFFCFPGTFVSTRMRKDGTPIVFEDVTRRYQTGNTRWFE